MKIQIGKFNRNKTYSYLFPIYKIIDISIIKKLDKLNKIAMGIYDMNVHNSLFTENNCIYILVDNNEKNENQINIAAFLAELSINKLLLGKYLVEPHLKNFPLMIVVKIPYFYKETYKHFLKGNYSKMYSKEEIEFLFASNSKERGVLEKNPTRFPFFIKEVKDRFGVQKLDIKEFYDKEWEFPLLNEEEIFSYKNKDNIYFSVQRDKIWNV